MHFDELSLAVVGARFDNPRRKGQPTGSREMEIMLCSPGDPVRLTAEPENKADENAIAVYSERDVQIGYISADRTSLLHRAWHDALDVKAVFQRRTSYGAVIRVTFDGNDPSLPPDGEQEPSVTAVEGIDPDSGFDGVDYIPPDE